MRSWVERKQVGKLLKVGERNPGRALSYRARSIHSRYRSQQTLFYTLRDWLKFRLTTSMGSSTSLPRSLDSQDHQQSSWRRPSFVTTNAPTTSTAASVCAVFWDSEEMALANSRIKISGPPQAFFFESAAASNNIENLRWRDLSLPTLRHRVSVFLTVPYVDSKLTRIGWEYYLGIPPSPTVDSCQCTFISYPSVPSKSPISMIHPSVPRLINYGPRKLINSFF
jgi:hypothetical protein